MKLLRQSSDNCLLYAAAMVLETSPEQLLTIIGHDGEEVWWPKEVGSRRKRSFHPQEILDAAAVIGKSFVFIEILPTSGWSEETQRRVFDTETAYTRFEKWLTNRCAILIVDSGSLRHAVAWDGNIVYDPKGFTKSIDDYSIESAYILVD